MTMISRTSRLFWLMILLSYTAAFDDDSFFEEVDLCYQNLTALDQYSKTLDAIPPNTVYIILCHNNLKRIQPNTFFKYKKLERIVLSNNQRFQFPADGSPALSSFNLIDFVCEKCGIVEIYCHSLKELPLLENLVLSNNSISQIDKHAFRKNRHLKEIDLSSNLLPWIPSTLLIGLHDIEILDLSFNRELAPVENKPFLRSNSLEILKCNSCGFTSIDGNTFVKLTNLKEVHLKGNPVFLVQQSVSLSRAVDLLTILSTSKQRSTIDFQSSEEDLEINLEIDSEFNSDEKASLPQTPKSTFLVIQLKH